MVDKVISGEVQPEDTIVTNARHYHALKEVARSLTDIKNGLDNKLAGDLLALDIRRGLHYLGEITGEITNEDQLDYIFSKFCIGSSTHFIIVYNFQVSDESIFMLSFLINVFLIERK